MCPADSGRTRHALETPKDIWLHRVHRSYWENGDNADDRFRRRRAKGRTLPTKGSFKNRTPHKGESAKDGASERRACQGRSDPETGKDSGD